MAQTFTVPSRTYPAGSTLFGPFTITAGSTHVKASLTRAGWPDSGGAEIISIEIERSTDGVNWSFFFQFGTAGGVLPNDRNGQPVTSSSLETAIVTPCQLRGTAILQQPLTTIITVALT